MTSQRFSDLCEQTFARIRELQKAKGAEYAAGHDVLIRFKEAGQGLGVNPEQVLWIFLDKHLSAIRQYIADEAKGVARSRTEPIQGRIDDAMNYLLFLTAILKERARL